MNIEGCSSSRELPREEGRALSMKTDLALPQEEEESPLKLKVEKWIKDEGLTTKDVEDRTWSQRRRPEGNVVAKMTLTPANRRLEEGVVEDAVVRLAQIQAVARSRVTSQPTALSVL